MAESITGQSTVTIPVVSPQSDIAKAETKKAYVCTGGAIDVVAPLEDTTLYTVPEGKTFYLTKVLHNTTGTAVDVPFYDSAGNVASGAAIVTLIPCLSTAHVVETKFDVPVAFQIGVTLDSGDMFDGVDINYMIHGYLV